MDSLTGLCILFAIVGFSSLIILNNWYEWDEEHKEMNKARKVFLFIGGSILSLFSGNGCLFFTLEIMAIVGVVALVSSIIF
ncbi:hypothetical protein RCG23_13200 [Neobacillus sp. PS3-34]|uniref:hypothetical protein n=1 Tax=Neobacillus sp. PS3-34 TaxID=3070678 RepID=UPI0027E1E22C|nr:hypothetical protein [Neobacillus sp. PS3-34]WML46612.1 hypothetical protein RCG23_13200 [Neobacillus sp. PS3-34]